MAHGVGRATYRRAPQRFVARACATLAECPPEPEGSRVGHPGALDARFWR